MSDTIRKQIVDAFVTVLSTGTTSIVTVTRNREPWWDWDVVKFPGVCVLEGAEKKYRDSFANSTATNSMRAEMEINVLGYVQDFRNDLATKRTDLVRSIENAVAGSTTLNDLTLDVVMQSVESDQGTVDNYAITHNRFMVKYLYNFAST